MPAKKRAKKTTARSNRNASQKKTSKSKIIKPIRKKTTKIAKKPNTKKIIKKVAKKKTITKPKKVVKKPTTKRVVQKTIIKEVSSASDEKFNLLLQELRSIKENNNELANQINAIQNEKEVQQETTIVQADQNKGEDSKEELMSKLKGMLAKGKEISKEEEKLVDTTPRESVFNIPLISKTENSKPPVIKESEKEEFKTTKTKGLISPEESKEYSALLKNLLTEVNKVFIGQEDVVEGVILSLICDAHTLLEGVPGLAKSLLIEVLGKCISGTTFTRIQFLPDLLPSDIIGGQIFNPKTAQFVTHKGPIFANFVLADEINRAPPKTHAAVMEAMAEKKINIENDEFILDRPFLILATQNPLENKGTYQLPEAVLDRFMFKVILNYPKRSDELKIITENATTKNNLQRKIKPVMDKQKLLEIQQKVRNVYISDKIREYILDLVEATRGMNKDIQGVKFLKYGAGVRASIYLGIAAKAKALLNGRNYVLPDDVYNVVPDIFRHRLSLNYKGKAHNISTDKIIEEVLKKVNAI